MILADENIHGFIIKTLRQAGYEVVLVREIAGGGTDEKVIQIALENNYLLLTEDKDFGEWVFAHHIKDLSVVFLRYTFDEFHEMPNAVINLLEVQNPERPFFATITAKKIRIRKL